MLIRDAHEAMIRPGRCGPVDHREILPTRRRGSCEGTPGCLRGDCRLRNDRGGPSRSEIDDRVDGPKSMAGMVANGLNDGSASFHI